jgi:putative hemolysin
MFWITNLTELVIIILLVVLNGIFAMAEIALVSSKKVLLEDLAGKGSKGAKISLKLLEEPEKFLSTIQIGITLVGIVAGAYGGLALAEDVEPFFVKFNIPLEYIKELSLITVVAFITYLSLLIGELLPKTIALNNPEKISVKLAPLVYSLSVASTPVVSFLSFSTKILTKIIRVKKIDKPPVTEDELKMLIEQGRKYGVFEQKESEMVKSVFRFYDRKAYSVMVPRQDIVWLDCNKTLKEITETIYQNNFSKFPLCNGSLDNTIGILHVRDFFLKHSNNNAVELKNIVVQPLIIPENLAAKDILEKFRETKIYIALVVDEYGSIQGMITLHDLIENVFGELPEITDKIEHDFFERTDGSFLVDGSVQIDEFKDKFKIEFDGEENYSTLAGFILYKLNKIPGLGDKFTFAGFEFEVVDMDGKRIDKVLVRRIVPFN